MSSIGVWTWAKKVHCWLGDKEDVDDDQQLEWDSEEGEWLQKNRSKKQRGDNE